MEKTVNWINIFGIIIVVLMLIPNIIYAFKFKGAENKCKNKVVNFLEQIGRYGSMFLMIFNIGMLEFGFSSKLAFLVWVNVMFLLLIAYWVGWILYFKRPVLKYSMALAIIPSFIFLLSGILLRHYLLVVFAVIFSVGHVHVSYVNSI